ncbi:MULTISPECIES: HAMP domain-containing sensor histidine kinase [unclassified Clostridium]|uniref:HAMP domain-containing sensor histidine kinase n=1 Tax=unclassified Clostridium TaxID=2614128 RepID=UPI0002986C64|nr:MULTISPECIES: HAMP domain-containing sensor histidine kinase [unclassified Clostridium]EKQ56247.1 MAG: histidine kinase,HAMP domain-containing protein,histidine kinase [Clostridium sp. Maddingley MBC34-26]
MKRSLSKRLFGITLSLVIALMLLTYFAQAFFFENFYSYKKTISLVKEVNKFNDLYSLHIDSDADLYKALQKFENDNNAQIIIFQNGKIMYASNTIYGNQESYDSFTSSASELINDKDLINQAITYSQPRYKNFENESTGLRKIGVVSPMSLNNKNDSLIFCIASIQPIKEASEVISEFFLYLFFGLIIVSIILALIYSNLISKPLVNLTLAANKISKMNFTEVCETDREDEIGSLAKSLNFLSKNLQTALLDLQQKNKKLELDIEKERQLEDMRKDFISNVSHELKTPIGIIEGYAEGLKDGIVSGEDANMYLETIIDESKKMSVLVTNMLELSKLESGTIKPNFEAFNINRLIKKILKKHSIDFEENKFNVSFNSSTPYSYVYADPFQMEQVLTNIITNAIKYTPPNNNINISIEEGLDKFKISVQNMGVTIPDEEISKLFDKFYRLDKSRERTQKNSTGIGLSIVKNILHLHNSEFNLQNINGGVEFYFYLEKIVSPEEQEEF